MAEKTCRAVRDELAATFREDPEQLPVDLLDHLQDCAGCAAALTDLAEVPASCGDAGDSGPAPVWPGELEGSLPVGSPGRLLGQAPGSGSRLRLVPGIVGLMALVLGAIAVPVGPRLRAVPESWYRGPLRELPDRTTCEAVSRGQRIIAGIPAGRRVLERAGAVFEWMTEGNSLGQRVLGRVPAVFEGNPTDRRWRECPVGGWAGYDHARREVELHRLARLPHLAEILNGHSPFEFPKEAFDQTFHDSLRDTIQLLRIGMLSTTPPEGVPPEAWSAPPEAWYALVFLLHAAAVEAPPEIKQIVFEQIRDHPPEDARLARRVRLRVEALGTTGYRRRYLRDESCPLGLDDMRRILLQGHTELSPEGLCYRHEPMVANVTRVAGGLATLALARFQHAWEDGDLLAALGSTLDPGWRWPGLLLLLRILPCVGLVMALIAALWVLAVSGVFRRSLQRGLVPDPGEGVRVLAGWMVILGPVAVFGAGTAGGLLWWVAIGSMTWLNPMFPAQLGSGAGSSLPGALRQNLEAVLFRDLDGSIAAFLMLLAGAGLLGWLAARVLIRRPLAWYGPDLRWSWLLAPIAAVSLVTLGSWIGDTSLAAPVTIGTLGLLGLWVSPPEPSTQNRRLVQLVTSCGLVLAAQVWAGAHSWGFREPRESWTLPVLVLALAGLVVPAMAGFLAAHLPVGHESLRRRLVGTAFFVPVLGLGPQLLAGLLEVLSPVLPHAASGQPPFLAGSPIVAGILALLALPALSLRLGFHLAPDGAAAFAEPPADETWPRLVSRLLRPHRVLLLPVLALATLAGLRLFSFLFFGDVWPD